uniref:RanBD1 domain-containing protein n=1 Tax=Gongylonema pulchrum TaxID=637853 RepID=A0A183DHL1_9BILA
LAKCEAVQGGTSFIESLPEVKNRSYNRELGKDRHNIELWLKFVAHQDEMFLSLEGGDNSKKTRAERLTSRQLFERKMSILDKAISLNYSCVRLKIERLKIGMHLWDEDKWNVELREVEFKHVNDPEMWQGVLDVLESDTRRFNFVAQVCD